jgi:hypothetical protein
VLPHYPSRGRYDDALESSSPSTEPGQLQNRRLRMTPLAKTSNSLLTAFKRCSSGA